MPRSSKKKQALPESPIQSDDDLFDSDNFDQEQELDDSFGGPAPPLLPSIHVTGARVHHLSHPMPLFSPQTTSFICDAASLGRGVMTNRGGDALFDEPKLKVM